MSNRKKIKGNLVIKANGELASMLEESDIEELTRLTCALSNTDQVLAMFSGKMPKKDMVLLMERREANVLNLEKFIKSIYKKYELDDDVCYGFDPTLGEIVQLPAKRPVWKFR